MTRKLAILPIPLMLAACGWFDQQPEAEQSAGVQGELLEGSISDEMIPVDELRSQSPRAATLPSDGGGPIATNHSPRIMCQEASGIPAAAPKKVEKYALSRRRRGR